MSGSNGTFAIVASRLTRWLLITAVCALGIAAAIVPGAPAAAVEQTCNATALRPGDRWRGSYTCRQGPTALVLAISAVRGAHVDAVFEFEWRDVRGRFELSGELETSSCRLHLRPM